MQTTAKLEDFLKDSTVADLKSKTEIIPIAATDSVADAMKELAKRKILSMPVLDKKKSKYVGIISISDIVIATVFNPAFAKLAKGASAIDKLTREDFKKIIEKSVLNNPVCDLVGMTEEGKNLWAFDEKESLTKVSEYFAQGVHRALISHQKGNPSFISQTDLVRFISKKVKESKDKDVANFLNNSLEKLGYVRKGKKIISVSTTETALAGFRRLLQWQSFRDWNLAALPIVDKDGKVVGNLSESDLREMNAETRLLDLLFVTPLFLKTYCGEMRKPVVVSPETSFVDALDKLISESVHRVWIVDKDSKPIGVFSLSDVISQFTPFAWSHEKVMDGLFTTS
uniref:Putative SNF4 kinase-activating protein n=1 Tax=Gymnochlora stellata TaxID=67809 RepID=B5A4K2_GYMST|nr:putative SNF4 kinase-activating protein [Gymnochlora stellata]